MQNGKYIIAIRNNISEKGLGHLTDTEYVQQHAFDSCDGIIVRSETLPHEHIPHTCKAIARAGVGVNNIPVTQLTERGVVVFNTPGANANSVKELVLAGLLTASRPIIPAIQWVRSLNTQRASIDQLIEEQKTAFTGAEIAGKTLGVIGLGAIGVHVSNAAESLGMRVMGYDPYITVLSAWGLSSAVQHVDSLQRLFKQSDYVTLHVPLNETTKHMINADILRHAKRGLTVLNFARAELIDMHALHDALEAGKIARCITDFPHANFIHDDRIIAMPHLGASTTEAEENCAVMATNQLVQYLKHGNITNSVNLPTCIVERSTPYRLTIINKNIPNIVGQVTTILAADKINIQDLTNRHKDTIAYNIIDLDQPASEQAISQIKKITGIIAVRSLGHSHRHG